MQRIFMAYYKRFIIFSFIFICSIYDNHAMQQDGQEFPVIYEPGDFYPPQPSLIPEAQPLNMQQMVEAIQHRLQSLQHKIQQLLRKTEAITIKSAQEIAAENTTEPTAAPLLNDVPFLSKDVQDLNAANTIHASVSAATIYSRNSDTVESQESNVPDITCYDQSETTMHSNSLLILAEATSVGYGAYYLATYLNNLIAIKRTLASYQSYIPLINRCCALLGFAASLIGQLYYQTCLHTHHPYATGIATALLLAHALNIPKHIRKAKLHICNRMSAVNINIDKQDI